MDAKKNKPYPRLATNDGIRVDKSSASPRSRRARSLRKVKRVQLLERKNSSLRPKGLDDGRPVLLTYSLALGHLLGSPVADLNIARELRQRAPEVKDLIDPRNGFAVGHAPIVTSDNQSGQGRTRGHVTAVTQKRTMCPMGKATTPTSFKVLFCQRVKAARITAGLTQGQVAHALGIPEDTYGKYERRSLPPHYLIPKLADILDVPVEFLFTGNRHREAMAS